MYASLRYTKTSPNSEEKEGYSDCCVPTAAVSLLDVNSASATAVNLSYRRKATAVCHVPTTVCLLDASNCLRALSCTKNAAAVSYCLYVFCMPTTTVPLHECH